MTQNKVKIGFSNTDGITLKFFLKKLTLKKKGIRFAIYHGTSPIYFKPTIELYGLILEESKK